MVTNIKIHKEGRAKFIIYKHNTDTIWLVSDPSQFYHSDIFFSEMAKGEGKFEIMGGGRLEIDSNLIYAYGHSTDYGPADQELVKSILEEHIKDKEIKVEMGVRH